MHLIVNGEKQMGRSHFKGDAKKDKKSARREQVVVTDDYVLDNSLNSEAVEKPVGVGDPFVPETVSPYGAAPGGFDSIAETFDVPEEEPIAAEAPLGFGDAPAYEAAPEHNTVPTAPEEPKVEEEPLVFGEEYGESTAETLAQEEHTVEATEPVTVNEETEPELPKVIEDNLLPVEAAESKKGLALHKREKPVKAEKPEKPEKPKKAKAAAEIDEDILEEYADTVVIQRDKLTFGFFIALIALVMASAAAGAFFSENIMTVVKQFLGV